MNTENILTAKHQAAYLSERLLIGYYAQAGSARDYHIRQAHEALRQAAEAMGYALEPIAQDDQDAA